MCESTFEFFNLNAMPQLEITKYNVTIVIVF